MLVPSRSSSKTSHQLHAPDIYRIALETMRYEGQLLWQIFVAFLVIHTVFVSFLFQSLTDIKSIGLYPGRFFASLGGLTLCLPWIASYLRNVAHYRYHLARARLLENKGWHLYGDSGRDFSYGEKVKVGDEYHQLGWLARHVQSGRMIPPVIAVFVIFYMAVISYTGLITCILFIYHRVL